MEKVKTEGYSYKKGFSRSASPSQNESLSSEEDKPSKRAKLMTSERQREIDNLSQLIAMTEDTIRMRQLQLSKAKTVRNFNQCAEISEKIRKLFKEKNDYCKQLAVLQKKEAKSAWYHKSKRPSSPSSHPKKKLDISVGDMKAVLQRMEKEQAEQSVRKESEETSDSSSHDTEILCSSSEDMNDSADKNATCTSSTESLDF